MRKKNLFLILKNLQKQKSGGKIIEKNQNKSQRGMSGKYSY